MPDSFYGGKEDLTSALGYEEDGVTTIIFRKKLEGSRTFFSSFLSIFFVWFFDSFSSQK